jgi:preprotein translocase subunit SecA
MEASLATAESSEMLSWMFKWEHIPPALNAKFRRQEAGIVSCARRPGGVTIFTNTARRGI